MNTTVVKTVATDTNSGIRKEVSVSALNVSRVYKSDFQKEGTLTAELKQTISTDSFYPSKSVSNSMQGNIFNMEDFGFTEQKFESSEGRVAWIDVPEGSTVESVVEKLKAFPDAMLYRVLSNKPILSDADQFAIDNPDLPDATLDRYANAQAVRFSENDPENAGKLSLDKAGKIQYRRIAFSTSKVEDLDMRTSDPEDFYVSPELKAEIENKPHVISGQTL